jgi:lipopolysaccharide/colanic/teichoic acid biosynthesis glycosyltransferase
VPARDLLTDPMNSSAPSVPSQSSAGTTSLPTWKRGLDLTCCIIALPILAVAVLWAFLMTSIFAPGPIFFRQERVGHRGRRFFLYKFRTMHVSANVSPHQAHFRQLMASNAPMQKLDARGDTRLIPGGWLLRASGFDELPQIINILRGEMSLVGPRPCIPYEYENYTVSQRNRLNSVPGLTGLWQVSGKNRTTFEQMVQLDIAYSKTLSLKSDLAIMLRTLPALWTQVADICKARAAANASQPATEFRQETSPGAAVSATFASMSQNVVSGANPAHRENTTRNATPAYVSYQSGLESESSRRPADRSGRQVV